MNEEEHKLICQACEKFMAVIHLDTCTETGKLVEVAVKEECPLGKWNVYPV